MRSIKLNTKKLRGSEALADFELMFSNCYLYNKPTDDVTLMCQEVESFFKQLVKKVPEPEVDIVPPEPQTAKAPVGGGGGAKPAGAKATPKNAKKQRPPPVKGIRFLFCTLAFERARIPTEHIDWKCRKLNV